MIYFIQEGDDGPIKIGSSKKPLTRLETLQIGNPRCLYLKGVLPQPPYSEARLLRIFSFARIHGEWHRPVKELLTFMKHMLPEYKRLMEPRPCLSHVS